MWPQEGYVWEETGSSDACIKFVPGLIPNHTKVNGGDVIHGSFEFEAQQSQWSGQATEATCIRQKQRYEQSTTVTEKSGNTLPHGHRKGAPAVGAAGAHISKKNYPRINIPATEQSLKADLELSRLNWPMHYKALTKTFVTDITSPSYSTEYTYNFGSGTICWKWKSWLGMSQRGQIEVRNPIVPIDLQMGEWNWFFFFFFSEVDNAGIFHSSNA